MTNEEENMKLKNELIRTAGSLTEIANLLPATGFACRDCSWLADAYQTVRAHRLVVGEDITRWDESFIDTTELELMIFYLRLNHMKDNMQKLLTTGRGQ